jgi:hypothetical protein
MKPIIIAMAAKVNPPVTVVRPHPVSAVIATTKIPKVDMPRAAGATPIAIPTPATVAQGRKRRAPGNVVPDVDELT